MTKTEGLAKFYDLYGSYLLNAHKLHIQLLEFLRSVCELFWKLNIIFGRIIEREN